ncbi:MAG: DUF943 family protein [Pantoea sp.]|nr:DUF943 family protein [Pantoea sp.]
MQINNRQRAILLLVGAALLIYLAWFFLRPVDIVAVHKRGRDSTAVLVRNFPLTAKGKINWWLENRIMLKEKYNVPAPNKDGSFSMTFWLFGDGYKEDKIDERLCFDDIKTDKRCIEKDAVFTVSRNRYNRTFFTVYNGRYILENDGKLFKVK